MKKLTELMEWMNNLSRFQQLEMLGVMLGCAVVLFLVLYLMRESVIVFVAWLANPSGQHNPNFKDKYNGR